MESNTLSPFLELNRHGVLCPRTPVVLTLRYRKLEMADYFAGQLPVRRAKVTELSDGTDDKAKDEIIPSKISQIPFMLISSFSYSRRA